MAENMLLVDNNYEGRFFMCTTCKTKSAFPHDSTSRVTCQNQQCADYLGPRQARAVFRVGEDFSDEYLKTCSPEEISSLVRESSISINQARRAIGLGPHTEDTTRDPRFLEAAMEEMAQGNYAKNEAIAFTKLPEHLMADAEWAWKAGLAAAEMKVDDILRKADVRPVNEEFKSKVEPTDPVLHVLWEVQTGQITREAARDKLMVERIGTIDTIGAVSYSKVELDALRWLWKKLKGAAEIDPIQPHTYELPDTSIDPPCAICGKQPEEHQ